MQTAMNLTFRFLVCRDGNAALQFLLHAVNCVRFCFWHCDFFVCVWNIPGTAERICAKFTQKTCLVPHSHEFEGQGHQGQKTAFFGPFSGLHAAYVWWNIFSLLFFLNSAVISQAVWHSHTVGIMLVYNAKRYEWLLPELPLGTIATLGSVPPFSLLRLGRWAGGGMRRLATFPRLWRPCWRAVPTAPHGMLHQRTIWTLAHPWLSLQFNGAHPTKYQTNQAQSKYKHSLTFCSRGYAHVQCIRLQAYIRVCCHSNKTDCTDCKSDRVHN